jgi:hypothetical protein
MDEVILPFFCKEFLFFYQMVDPYLKGKNLFLKRKSGAIPI